MMLCGCGGGGAPKPEAAPPAAAKVASPIVYAPGPRPAPPAGCEWVMNELALPEDEFLLYMAAKCNGKVKTLDYAGGAHKAELTYGEDGPVAVQILSAEPDGQTAILEHARELIDRKADAARCAVRPARNPRWPEDALVVDVKDADTASDGKGTPRSACGPYGFQQNAQNFWRVINGFTWFFSLGTGAAEIDPGSFTVAVKDAQGNWKRAGN
jgi:hypothetical protein